MNLLRYFCFFWGNFCLMWNIVKRFRWMGSWLVSLFEDDVRVRCYVKQWIYLFWVMLGWCHGGIAIRYCVLKSMDTTIRRFRSFKMRSILFIPFCISHLFSLTKLSSFLSLEFFFFCFAYEEDITFYFSIFLFLQKCSFFIFRGAIQAA